MTPESIALIDISYLFKKRWHTNTDSAPMGAARATLRDLESLDGNGVHLIICRDAPPYAHRLAISPEYKANRPEMDVEEKAQRKWLYAELQRIGYPVAWSQGYEADDVIATLARLYSKECDDVRIVGPDKDAAQCLTDRVTQYIPPIGMRDWEVRDVAAATKKFGVPPELMVLYQGLAGDSGDNIPGVPRIGPKIAAELANKYKTLGKLAEGVAMEAAAGKAPAYLNSLAQHWDQLVLSMKLATLDTNVPLDTAALLVRREALPEAPKHNVMDITTTTETEDAAVFTRNETPMPPKQEGVSEVALKEASAHYQAKLAELDAKRAAEAEYDRERAENEESDPISNAPGDKAAEPVAVVMPPAGRRASVGLAKAPEPQATVTKYGTVDANLQPLDLHAAYTLSQWLHKGGLYQQYQNEAQVFTIIARGKELGIPMNVALANHHIIEGKPTASADLIRALCEKDPSFVYLVCLERSATRVVWEGMRRGNPGPTKFSYTIEEAQAAGLVKLGKFGKPGNWMVRPQDMLSKTAASKLARELWPAATMGLYCFEEFGFTQEELEQAA